MITRDQLIVIGHYNKAHGVDGEISATLDIDIDTIQQLDCLISDIDGIYVPFFVNACRAKSASTVLLRLDGIGTDAEAAALAGRDVYVLKSVYEQLASEADDDAMPLDFFIGFEVHDRELPIGHITGVNDSTDNVLFLVERPDGSTAMVPAVDDLIAGIDEERRLLVMELPEGLLDL